MGLHPETNSIAYELSEVHADLIPWFYTLCHIWFDVAGVPCCHNGTLPYKSTNSNYVWGKLV